MKKSRIILPAAALLALSSAAAVTGTVAWFQASRIKTISFTGVTAVNPEEGLVFENYQNVSGTTGSVDAVAHVNKLRDASYNPETKKLYRSVLSEAGEITAYQELAGVTAKDTKKYDGSDVYFATQFTVDAKITRFDSSYTQALMFDAAHSTAALSEGTIGDTSVLHAFRVCIATASKSIIWAPLSENLANAVEVVNGTTLSSHAVYANVVKNDAITADDSSTIPATSAVEAEKDFLVNLTESATTITITTWFDGLEPDCITGAADLATNKFVSTLQFALRKHKAA